MLLLLAYVILLDAPANKIRIPLFFFNLKDTEITTALETKMAFYASLVPGIALTTTKWYRQQLQTKSDPTTKLKNWITEEQSAVIHFKMPNIF